MSRRALVTLVVLAVLATAGGVAGGLVLARPSEPATAAPEPTTTTTAPVTTDTLEPLPSSSTTAPTTSTTTTTTTTRISVQARVVRRLEDGLVVGYQASQPVTAVLAWGFGGSRGNEVPFPGPSAQGSVKVTLARSTREISMRVIARAADGREGVSGTLTGRRLVRQVVLEVRSLQLNFQNGTAGIATGFLGTTITPLGPGLAGPTATAEPYSFPAVAVAAGATGSPLALRFFHQPPNSQQQTRVVNLAITYPNPGTSTILTRDVTAIGVTVHLRLRLTVTRS